MKTMTKREQIKEYNLDNPGYHITGIKSMTADELASYRKYGASSLNELYKNPSEYKLKSYYQILRQYNVYNVVSVQGSCHSYSVLLRAENGDLLHITKDNNYLVKEV
jgi:hypothetical protein